MQSLGNYVIKFNVNAYLGQPIIGIVGDFDGAENPGGRGVLPYISYIGMCHCEG